MKKVLSVLFILFGMLFITSCNAKDDYKLTVVSPSGAPGIALADLKVNHGEDYDITLNLTADALKTEFANKTSDVIIAPINLGVTMYNKTATYRLASVLTWGNLYFASQMESFKAADLNAATLTMFGQSTINDAIVKYILEKKQITISEDSTYLGSTQLTVQELLSNKDAICLVAEPALSTAMSKKKITAISVQDLYKEVTKSDSYPQAGCFIRSDVINEHKAVVDEFLTKLEASCQKCQDDVETIASYSVDLQLGNDAAVMAKAIPNSNIKYVTPFDAKHAIESLVTVDHQLFGGKMPDLEFYYAKNTI